MHLYLQIIELQVSINLSRLIPISTSPISPPSTILRQAQDRLSKGDSKIVPEINEVVSGTISQEMASLP